MDANDGSENSEDSTSERTRAPRAERPPKRPLVSSPPSTSESPRGKQPPQRKPTYLVQKEEKEDLEDEICVLRERVEQLRRQAGLPTAEERASVSQTQAQNFDMEEVFHANRLYLARIHSLLSHELQALTVNPLSTNIHLPADRNERRTLLRAMKGLKIRRAQEAAVELLHGIDTSKNYLREERYMGANNMYHCNRFQVVRFPGCHGVREVFDAVLDFVAINTEIRVTETLGQLTVREESDDVDASIWNQRIVTATDLGYSEELNLVFFSHFYDNYIPLNGSHFGVIAVDTVDDDDLYPYQPHDRTRKDFQGVYTVSECGSPGQPDHTVLLKMCLFNTQRPPEFDIPESVVQALYENMSNWIVIMVKSLQERFLPRDL